MNKEYHGISARLIEDRLPEISSTKTAERDVAPPVSSPADSVPKVQAGRPLEAEAPTWRGEKSEGKGVSSNARADIW